MPPMSIETLALAVCGGLFHLTTPVFVMRVPIARPGRDGGPEAQNHGLARLEVAVHRGRSRR